MSCRENSVKDSFPSGSVGLGDEWRKSVALLFPNPWRMTEGYIAGCWGGEASGDSWTGNISHDLCSQRGE